MTRARAVLVAGALALAAAAVAARQAPPPAAGPPAATRLFLRPLTSFWQHLEEGSFEGPRGVYVDRANREVWVADSGNHRVGIFTPDGLPLYAAQPGGGVREPVRLAVDREGRVLVLDADRSRIAVLDWRGRYRGRLELPGLPERPVIGALALDERGQLYVGENSAGEVLVYAPDLRLRFRFGARGDRDGEFLAIADIEPAGDRILVVDHLARPVQVFDRQGNFLFGFGAHQLGAENFSLPEAVAVDSKGRMVVVDALRHEIKVFAPDGRFLDRFGGAGYAPGQVAGPCDVAIDGEDRIFVAERSGGRVQVFGEVEVPVPPSQRRRPARRVRE